MKIEIIAEIILVKYKLFPMIINLICFIQSTETVMRNTVHLKP